MLTVLTGLLSSVSYATSDMMSQHVTRATRAVTQIVWVLGTGVVIIAPVALIVRGLPGEGEWRGAGLAGLDRAPFFFAPFFLLPGLRGGGPRLLSGLASPPAGSFSHLPAPPAPEPPVWPPLF